MLGARNLPSVQPTVKRFTVGNVHSAQITALAWSRNGMRLFSGDADGVVSVVDINYQTTECTAKKLLKETSSITQLSYTYEQLAVSTVERAFVYSIPQEQIKQVGQKPRKYSGLFGCAWSPSASRASSVLYTSRPGLRFWSATPEGEVLHTHIIKELPERGTVQLLNPSYEKPREGETFSFGLLHVLGMSRIVSYNQHWLFVIDIDSLKVVAFSGKFRHITGVAVSEQEIFVLEGSRNISCLSTEPLNIGAKKSFSSLKIAPFPQSQNLREIGSRIVTKGSGLFEQIARVSSSVAAKVSEHANSSVITGQEIGSNSATYQVSPMTSSLVQCSQELQNSEQLATLSSANVNRSKQGHHRSSSSGMVQGEQFSHSMGPSQPRMSESVSSFFPSLFSSPLLITSSGKTPPIYDVTNSVSIDVFFKFAT